MPELEEFIRTYSISILIGVVSAVILGAAAALVSAERAPDMGKAFRGRRAAALEESDFGGTSLHHRNKS